MPKIINYDNQKESIAEAAWRVIKREGIENASVRNIAKEAGISSGALQHYFSSQVQLLEFAMNMVFERVEDRFTRISNEISSVTLENAKKILWNLMPVNEEQELEMEVWLSLTVKAFHESSLNKISKSTYEAIHLIILTLLKQLEEAGLLKKGLKLSMEAKRLHILLDGLSLHRMVSPDTMTSDVFHSILDQHLRELTNNLTD
ncbi:HTH-type transcriptional regulator PksA [Anaerocolumna cellulosilytica]|uniref:HTH-type transcriptional regulator PksA n=1 Tax=Anaerocolumna cellulosilytica TaxID=433286 RepID=A0A6S6R4B9_9FIRM|nr:TetR family transcriptional regulator C-terminal domain-containing protein [Anaerocolumna cellulosilytica]MBB5196645.1 AcrR family transcriptional regulator [Anaerocolumna cellulosilytica]BCJ93908.1 HTH-type transcriptional regulator PksA [Anaerocolumna cellulosilytica]